MVFELLGSNLLDLIKLYHYRGIPIPIVKYITRQVLVALDFIHRTSVIHTDLKPENVLLGHIITEELYRPKKPAQAEEPKTEPAAAAADYDDDEDDEKEAGTEQAPDVVPATATTGTTPAEEEKKADAEEEEEEEPLVTTPVALVPPPSPPAEATEKETLPFKELYRAYLADFGNANWTSSHFTEDIQTRQYRSPEVILGAQWSTPVDLWSLACMVFELLTGDFLFEPKSGDGYSKEDDHLCQMIELLGPMPRSLLRGKHAPRYFNKKGQLLHIAPEDMHEWPLQPILHEKYQFSEEDSKAIADFLLPMLVYEPLKRKNAHEMLRHPWLADV